VLPKPSIVIPIHTAGTRPPKPDTPPSSSPNSDIQPDNTDSGIDMGVSPRETGRGSNTLGRNPVAETEYLDELIAGLTT